MQLVSYTKSFLEYTSTLQKTNLNIDIKYQTIFLYMVIQKMIEDFDIKINIFKKKEC